MIVGDIYQDVECPSEVFEVKYADDELAFVKYSDSIRLAGHHVLSLVMSEDFSKYKLIYRRR